MSDAPKFKPKSLKAESIEAPLEARWKILGPEEAKKLHEKAIDEHRRFRRFGPRTQKRALRLGLGGLLVFTAITWPLVGRFFWPAPLLGLFAGLVVTALRPPDTTLALLYGGAGFTSLLGGYGWSVHSAFEMICLAGGTLIFSAIGWGVGLGEDLRRLDGTE